MSIFLHSVFDVFFIYFSIHFISLFVHVFIPWRVGCIHSLKEGKLKLALKGNYWFDERNILFTVNVLYLKYCCGFL